MVEFEVQLLAALCDRQAGVRELARRFKRSPVSVAFELKWMCADGLVVEGPVRGRFGASDAGREAVAKAEAEDREGAA
jgi:Mn-dependent DtxR family transcriptional regulator